MIVEDINVYFKYYGEPAVYHETASASHNIKAVFERTPNYDGDQTTYDIKSTVKAQDVPNVDVNKRFEIRSVNYFVKNIEQDGLNDDILILELSRRAV
jgi:hypothetical protein